MNVTAIGILIGGLGLFLFGMELMERALKELAGRTFKLFLRKHTKNRLKAIASGALVTGVLQSSSVVSLIVLAFVGAGVMNMENALGVVLGANFGTTLDAWVVATLGFKVDIESISYPVIGVAGIVLLLFRSRKKLVEYCNFFLGFGLLFLGLGLMKDSVSDLVEKFSLQEYADYPLAIFFVIGLVITTIIQSSSATMAITLSALNANAVSFENAIAIIIGAEIGSMLKLILSSLRGIAAKKQVALGNTIFNVVFAILCFALLYPVVYLIQNVLHIRDPLIGLVFFQSSMNLVTLILFFPFLKWFTGFLSKRFSDDKEAQSEFISKVDPDVPEAAGEALEKETSRFLERVIALNRSAFPHEKERTHDDPDEKYAELKQLEGEIQVFYSKLREEQLSNDEQERFATLAGVVRNGMYAAKGVKDIRHNLEELSASAEDAEFKRYGEFQKTQEEFWELTSELLESKKANEDDAEGTRKKLQEQHDHVVGELYRDAEAGKIDDVQLSTLLNVNRELHSSNKALFEALKEFRV